MVNRTELFNYHNVFSVNLEGETYYVYCIPYYNTVYTGRSIFPDGGRMYLISGGMYAKLVTMKHKDSEHIASYVEYNIDDHLMKENGELDGFIYIGDYQDFLGSQSSAVMQAVIQYTSAVRATG